MTPIAQVIPIETLPSLEAQLCEVPVGEVLASVVGRSPTVVGSSHTSTLSARRPGRGALGEWNNQLLAAAHLCFENHLPFGLRAEVLWQTVLSQLAIAIAEDPEPYRHLFTSSAGRQEIIVREDRLAADPALWSKVILGFEEILQELFDPTLASACRLEGVSTIGPVERVAGAIALMKLASPFYDYVATTRCGIPEVALFGTVTDWERLHLGIQRLAVLFPSLGDWWPAVARVTGALAAAARGEALDGRFWRSIYRHDHRSGQSVRVSGWLAHLYLYTQRTDGTLVRRSAADWAEDDPNGDLSAELLAELTEHLGDIPDMRTLPPQGPWHPTLPELPPSISSLPFIWELFGVNRPMELVAGVLAIEWDGTYLTPRLGWALLEGGSAVRVPGVPVAAERQAGAVARG